MKDNAKSGREMIREGRTRARRRKKRREKRTNEEKATKREE